MMMKGKEMGIREIQVQLEELRSAYEIERKRLEDQIQAIRSKRGYKAKQPSWDGYVEVGRDSTYRTPHGGL